MERSSTRKSLEPQPGTLIGGLYEIDRLLARGGVGVVYVARERSSGREVVVKVLAAHLTGESEANARFDREVERLSSIQHANIVEVLDHGYEGTAPFLVMEFLSGEQLLDYLNRKQRLTLAEFVPIAAQILKALGYAHARGLMHRDIKPGNIMLIVRKGRANFVKLLDFGMAKLVEGERDITSEQIVGTANYMAPEQVRGEPLDARVDVYACGLLFYRMLAGRLPFVADNNAALLYKQVHEIPPPLASALPPGHDAPPELLALIDRCLAKDPADRPADANAMTEALVACVPAQYFKLPTADGSEVTSSSSATGAHAEASASMSSGAEVSSGSLRRTAPRRKMMTQTGLRPPRPPTIRAGALPSVSVPVVPPVTAPLPPVPEPQGTSWLPWVLGGVALVALVGIVLLASGGGGGGGAAKGGGAVSSLEESRMSAQLDQVDILILNGEFPKAQQELAALRSAVQQVPALAARAVQQERRIAGFINLEVARKLEAEGDRAGAQKAYTEALAQDPANEEARAGLVRVSGEPPPETPPEEPTKKGATTPKKTTPKKTETKAETKAVDDSTFKLPSSKGQDPIFLPTGK